MIGDIHKPENLPNYIRRYGWQMDPIDIFVSLGNVKPTINKTYRHREGGRMHQFITVAAVANGGAGAGANNPIRVTIPTSQHTGSGLYSYPRIYDEVKFKDGKRGFIFAKDTGVAATTESVDGSITATSQGGATNGHVFLIYPKTLGDNITSSGSTPAVNDNIMIYSNSMTPRSTQRTGITPDARVYSNTVQELRDDIQIDPREMNTASWMNITNPQTGESAPHWYLESVFQTWWRYKQACHGALLFGDQTTNTTLTAAAPGLLGTEGLEKFIQGGGLTLPWNVAAGFTRNDFDQIGLYQTQNGGTLESTLFMGFNLYNSVEKELKVELQNTNISYASVGGQEKAVSLGFKSLNVNGYNYHFQRFQTFNDPKLGGISGHDYTNKGMLIPMGTAMVTKEDESQESLNYLTVRTLNTRDQQLGQDKEHWIIPPKKYNDKLQMTAHYQVIKGFHGHSANKFAWIEPS